MKKAFLVSLFASCLWLGGPDRSRCFAQSEHRPTGPKALWQPGMETMRSVRDACASRSGSDFSECFLAEMRKSGASSEAIEFSRGLAMPGFLRDFREAGVVDIAYVDYPFRANENQGWLLVNGASSMIDVDDFDRLPRSDLEKNSVYSGLAKQYPNVMVFPGDRAGTGTPVAETIPAGGQRFVVEYRLLDGCHACARVGTARFAFAFDRAGNLEGVKLAGVERVATAP